MWLLIECDDPATGPGHNETRRIIIKSKAPIMIDIPSAGIEVHPCTPGEDGYHCPICHKDIPPSKLQGRGCGEIIIDDDISNLSEPPSTQDEETIKKAVTELRKEFEYMAIRKMFDMHRNKIGEYLSPGTFCLWAGYWECAIKLGIIPDKIEYVNEG